ncbi:hypothetical protein EMPS_09816 [Entomortierella parvispora]|uniref:Uncharacterized protein n=1 Tax=Entomortierella parvispora TaxID=205924 RepID=A0A9P3HIV5_9FUNG|nr:hypothetical protein EMPS_09816 [Entomortierella parvispora]
MPSPPKKRILTRRQAGPNPSLVSLPDTPIIKRTIKRKARSPSIEEDEDEDEEENEPLIRRKKASAPIEKVSDSPAKLGVVAPPNETKSQISEESSLWCSRYRSHIRRSQFRYP